METLPNQPTPVVQRWPAPPPMLTGSPSPEFYFNGKDLYCTYYVRGETRPSFEEVAVLCFHSVLHFCVGHPNDEALEGHLLYKHGLRFYDFFLIEHSPLIKDLEMRNEVHIFHKPGMYSRFKHWIATFHDETLEVVSLDAMFVGNSELSPLDAIRSIIEKRGQR